MLCQFQIVATRTNNITFDPVTFLLLEVQIFYHRVTENAEKWKVCVRHTSKFDLQNKSICSNFVTLSQHFKLLFSFKTWQNGVLSKNNRWFLCILAVYPRVSLHPGPHYAIEGSKVTLPRCHVTGYPAPVVIWRKASGQLPQERVKYNNSNLQLLNAREIDSDWYICSATNLLGSFEMKTLAVIVSHLRFNVQPPWIMFARHGDTLTLNCSVTGGLQPVISWRKQEGHLPVGRSHQIDGALVIRGITDNDTGYYICAATSAVVFGVKTLTYVQVKHNPRQDKGDRELGIPHTYPTP